MNRSKIIAFYLENGLYLTLMHAINIILRKLSSFFLSKKLKTKSLSISFKSNIRGLSHIKIGKNFYAGNNFHLEAITMHHNNRYKPQIIIKDNVAVNDYVHIAATNYVEIGNNVLMASKIYISDHNHGIYNGLTQSPPITPPNNRLLTRDQSVVIKDNVWIGEFVSILPGVIVGEGSIIGSHTVVTKDIPPFSIAVGNPAKVIKKYDFVQQKWIFV